MSNLTKKQEVFVRNASVAFRNHLRRLIADGYEPNVNIDMNATIISEPASNGYPRMKRDWSQPVIFTLTGHRIIRVIRKLKRKRATK